MIARRFCTTTLLLLSAQMLQAQVPADSGATRFDLESVVKAGEWLFNPAALALAHEKDLSLTSEQVTSLQALDRKNHIDIMSASRPSADETAMNEMLYNASSKLDEDVIRRGTKARVDREVAMALKRARAAHQVSDLLTPIQRVGFQALQMSSMADAMNREPSH